MLSCSAIPISLYVGLARKNSKVAIALITKFTVRTFFYFSVSCHGIPVYVHVGMVEGSQGT